MALFKAAYFKCLFYVFLSFKNYLVNNLIYYLFSLCSQLVPLNGARMIRHRNKCFILSYLVGDVVA